MRIPILIVLLISNVVCISMEPDILDLPAWCIYNDKNEMICSFSLNMLHVVQIFLNEKGLPAGGHKFNNWLSNTVLHKTLSIEEFNRIREIAERNTGEEELLNEEEYVGLLNNLNPEGQ